jgi:hypothetical protein
MFAQRFQVVSAEYWRISFFWAMVHSIAVFDHLLSFPERAYGL